MEGCGESGPLPALTSVCRWADRWLMRRGTPGKPRPKPDAGLGDAQRIDALYGLEPVIDVNPSRDHDGNSDSVQFQVVECPYCGEHFETSVDTSAGSARYVEDCQICCQPIDFQLEVDHDGVIQGLSTLRCE
jgi:hypothetical protein